MHEELHMLTEIVYVIASAIRDRKWPSVHVCAVHTAHTEIASVSIM